MRKIKRITSLALILCLVLGMTTACSSEEKKAEETPTAAPQEEVLPLKTGILTCNAAAEKDFEKTIGDHIGIHHKGAFTFELTYYDNLTSLLMALQAKDIYVMILADSVAEYVVAQNDTLVVAPELEGEGLNENTVSYMMMTREEDKDTYNKINDAIVALKEEGVIDKLANENIKEHTDGSTPEATEIPKIEGAETITVAVTGDIPPIDYVAADGTPAGFNVALLSEISKKANVNIEMIQVDAGARVATLTSGRADVLFWVNATSCTEHVDFAKGADIPTGTLTTEPYYKESISFVTFKQEK